MEMTSSRKLISISVLILGLLCGQCGQRRKPTHDINGATDKFAASKCKCDSIFKRAIDERKNGWQLEIVNNDSLDDQTLQKFQGSHSTRFVLSFPQDSKLSVEKLIAEYIYIDREESLLTPGRSGQGHRNYSFVTSQNVVFLKAETLMDVMFDTNDLMDSVKTILTRDFLGDSLAVAELFYLEFRFITPPDIEDFFYISENVRIIHSEILARLCEVFENDIEELNLRIGKLASLGFTVYFNWVGSPAYYREFPMPPPPVGSEDSI